MWGGCTDMRSAENNAYPASAKQTGSAENRKSFKKPSDWDQAKKAHPQLHSRSACRFDGLFHRLWCLISHQPAYADGVSWSAFSWVLSFFRVFLWLLLLFHFWTPLWFSLCFCSQPLLCNFIFGIFVSFDFASARLHCRCLNVFPS